MKAKNIAMKYSAIAAESMTAGKWFIIQTPHMNISRVRSSTILETKYQKITNLLTIEDELSMGWLSAILDCRRKHMFALLYR